MLSKAMVNKLNEHVTLEFYSSNLYLQMSAWADLTGLEGCTAFLRAHAQEEMMHMHKLFESLYRDMIDYLPFDDGWGDYEEPSITLN
jgi:ferritin